MSKRLQVILPDEDYEALESAARRTQKPIAHIVRDSLRRTLAESSTPDPDQKIAAVLRFARFTGPTGEIGQILEEIERGRGLS